ncbi:hypothetical protein [Endozoicomonas arenosclerae]|uniref:hypothetical protein n=1 Tax=Endozoicomonas arenosclerae TaxID=1633495 RepID=UPI000783EBFE|nr:hypothetical protein [Endozoicomonas arenosclerae]
MKIFKINSWNSKVSLAFITLLWATKSFSYGDGDDPLCKYGCLMNSAGKINEVRTYAHGAEIPVYINTGFSECPKGGYVAVDAKNRQELLSMILSAFHSQTDVRLQLYKSKEWSSTSEPTHCLIRAVRLYN